MPLTSGLARKRYWGINKGNHYVTETREATVTLTVEQLEQIIRKVVREELMAFITRDLFNLDKASPLHEDMEDILERKKSNQLKLHTHEDVWNE